MITYWWHPESEALMTANTEDEAIYYASQGCDEITEQRYNELLSELK